MAKLTRRWRTDHPHQYFQIWPFFPVDRGHHFRGAPGSL